MSWTPKTFGFIAVGSIVLIFLLGYGNHTLNSDQRNPYVNAIFLVLLLVFVYSLIPLFIALFVHGQGAVGNANLGPIVWLRDHQKTAAFAFWGIWTLGLLIAMPFMIRDFFDYQPPIGKSQGVLVANVGMTLDEVRKRSTLTLPSEHYQGLTGTSKIIGKEVVDFEIADTGTRFPSCRYYWIETGEHGDMHVSKINVGISARAVSKAELAEADRQVQQQLERDGWVAGQFYYRTEEQLTLHGGEKSSGRGWYWLKGEALLSLEHNRVDEEVRGEDSATAGKWIQYIDVWERKESIFSGLEFENGAVGGPAPH